MITTLHTNEGYIYAYIVWHIVDDDTRLDDDGKYIYIDDLWIHDNHRGNGVLTEFINNIFYDKRTQQTEFVYWHNNKHKRLSGIVPISRFLKKL